MRRKLREEQRSAHRIAGQQGNNRLQQADEAN